MYELGCIAGGESIEKCRKVDSLRLTVGEWEHVQTFEKLLAVCAYRHIWQFIINFRVQTADKAQQAFSYSSILTLCNVVPALEKLYATREKQQNMPEAKPFKKALDVGLKKVNEYYKKTSESDAHIMAMRIYFYCSLLHIYTHHLFQFSIRNVKWNTSERIGPRHFRKKFSAWQRLLYAISKIYNYFLS